MQDLHPVESSDHAFEALAVDKGFEERWLLDVLAHSDKIWQALRTCGDGACALHAVYGYPLVNSAGGFEVFCPVTRS